MLVQLGTVRTTVTGETGKGIWVVVCRASASSTSLVRMKSVCVCVCADSGMLTDMMKGNLTNVLPMIVIGGWINWAFSGFVISEFSKTF